MKSRLRPDYDNFKDMDILAKNNGFPGPVCCRIWVGIETKSYIEVGSVIT